jgi:hypothetical protein
MENILGHTFDIFAITILQRFVEYSEFPIE